MGAEQSSNRSSNGAAAGNAAAPKKTCYYEVMGLDRSATEDEIRKAYKRKALELHPDRNINDVENSTRKFAEVQTAYEILSDPQERAWYDSHRDAILSGDDADAGPGGAPSNLRITTVDEIYALMGRFNSAVRFDDSPNGFFATLDVFFGQLAAEETAACEWDALTPVAYPPFGSAADDYDAVAKPFYNVWSAFSTRKSFSWRDKYRLSDAEDRRVRRLMEKENKKFRDEGIRDFNDAVRSLTAFVKKRDPRYVPNTQSEAERQKLLRDSAAAQAARSRAANQEKLAEYVLPDWAQARNDNEGDQSDEFVLSDEDESEVEHIECVVCAKIFKSEMQFQAHERSKKHIKAVQHLRRQMKKENKDFDLDLDQEHGQKRQSDRELSTDSAEVVEAGAAAGKAPAASATDPSPPVKTTQDVRQPTDDSSEADSLDGDYAPRDKVQSRISGAPGDSGEDKDSPAAGTSSVVTPADDDSDAEGPAKTKKVGKAKQKKAKKAARQAAGTGQTSDHACTICKDSFPSRNALFAHLNEEHPAPKGKGAKKSKR